MTGRLTQHWQRLDGAGRLPGIDLARGLAVIGMLAAHLLVIDAFDPARAATWTDVVNGRSSILFATLAGVSIALTTGGARPVSGPARAAARSRLAVRAGLLWVLGIALVMTTVPIYVILPAYAVLFLLALPVLGWSAGRLLSAAGVIALVMPFVQPLLDDGVDALGPGGELFQIAVGWAYPFTTWAAFLLAGMGVARLDLRSWRTQVGALLFGGGLAVLAYSLAAALPAGESGAYLGRVVTADAHSSGILEVFGSGGFAVAVIALSLLVCRTPVRHVLFPLRATGSMPLTAYTAQVVVWAVWATASVGAPYLLAEFRALDPFWPITIGIVAGCTLWALLWGRGPLEALVDRVSRPASAGAAQRAR